MAEKLQVFAPYDQELIKELPMTTWDEADKILQQSFDLFNDRSRWMPKFERIKILKNFMSLLADSADELAKQSAQEGGKPLVDSIVEINRAIGGVEIAIQEITQLKGSEIPMELNEASKGHMAYTMIEPAGVVLALSAFNHPMNLIIHQVIPAIATGCPVIVKPASSTPLSCFSIVELLYKAGLPKEWCTAIVCSNDVSTKLAADSRIRFMTFIGSARVGWKLRAGLAPGVRCALEHGGVAPVIVEPDADIDAILPGILKAGYYHAGQVCVSIQRLFVHKDIIDEVRGKLLPMVKALKVGDPLDAKTEVGPLILPREVDRVDSWVKEAVEAGAELACGGGKVSDTCYEATLLVNPPSDAKVSTEEIFGPVVCLYEYTDYREAIDRANELPFSFQASIYTSKLDTALDSVKRLKAKAVMVNEHTAFRVDWMPFGGAENSGLGAGGIGYSMRDMCEEKLMVIKSGSV